eukprot:GGOE01001867.1.p1 GENE.GGOE01001867.1~~GGOE01001867.1.p1  ORF type:complete len:610 (-),score=151.06 GGOE01001867.1:246-2003(-)
MSREQDPPLLATTEDPESPTDQKDASEADDPELPVVSLDVHAERPAEDTVRGRAWIMKSLQRRPLGLPLLHWASVIFSVLIVLFFQLVELQPGCPRISHAAAGILLVAFWWIVQLVPAHIVALSPIAIFPLLGVAKGATLSNAYFNHTIFIIIGGHLIGIAMARWNLHRRLALLTMLLLGTRLLQILAAFMLTTWFLSMWMSNTASCLTMLPIALAVIRMLEGDDTPGEVSYFGKTLLLGLAYAATVGGMATPIGTLPNLVLIQTLKIRFPAAPEVGFGCWVSFGLPLSLALLLLIILFFAISVRLQMHRGLQEQTCSRDIIKRELHSLGPMAYEEKVVLVVFTLLAVLWTTRADLGPIPGWASLLPATLGRTVGDATVAMVVTLPMFLIPRKARGGQQHQAILDWEEIRSEFNVEVLLMLGGGFAIAQAFVDSGLSLWVGLKLSALAGAPLWVVILLLTAVPSLLTEFASNVASTQLLLPIAAELALQMQVNPLMLMIPVCMACQCSFILPMATPPNMVICSTGRLPLKFMAIHGAVVDVLAVVSVSLFMLFLFPWLSGFPAEIQDWVTAGSQPNNGTFVCPGL